jgi:hypothetical protein
VETLVGGSAGAPALPFGPARSPWLVFKPEAASGVEKQAPADTGTVLGVKGKAHGVLPMTWIAPEPTRPAPITELPIEDEETPPALEARAPEPETTPPEPVAAPEPRSEEEPVDVPIERCATIAASIARRPAEIAQILEEEKLDPETWAAIDKGWREAIREETKHGRKALLTLYDRAYVARLEEERGPIELEEYARLVLAAERGTLAEVLAEMMLPREAMVRIERVWLAKIMEEAGLAKLLRGSLRAAREA